jgi:Ca2+-binding RTX toxin-like protein
MQLSPARYLSGDILWLLLEPRENRDSCSQIRNPMQIVPRRTMRGGRFNDLLTGGAGDDQLFGGGGGDQFRFFGTQIEGKGDTDTIYDLNFAEGDKLVFGDFGVGTFGNLAGVKGFKSGTSVIIDSFADIIALDAASDLITALRGGPDGTGLLLQIVDADGQVQSVLLAGAYDRYLAASVGPNAELLL